MGIYDKERMIPYLKISRVIGGDAKYWAEYLAICAAFSHLYHKDKNFRHHVLNSDLTSSSKVGYFLQWKYRWNMTKFNSFLMSATSFLFSCTTRLWCIRWKSLSFLNLSHVPCAFAVISSIFPICTLRFFTCSSRAWFRR